MKNSISMILDEWLLRLTEIIAKYIYYFIGLNNFRLANIFYLIGWAGDITSVSLMSQFNSVIQTVVSSIFLVIVRSILWMVFVTMPSRFYKIGFRNYARISFVCTVNRVFSFCVVIIFFSFGPDKKIQTYILADHFADFGFLFTAMAFYFASIEPENPTDSWVKKKWNSFKRLFEWSPVAQPA